MSTTDPAYRSSNRSASDVPDTADTCRRGGPDKPRGLANYHDDARRAGDFERALQHRLAGREESGTDPANRRDTTAATSGDTVEPEHDAGDGEDDGIAAGRGTGLPGHAGGVGRRGGRGAGEDEGDDDDCADPCGLLALDASLMQAVAAPSTAPNGIGLDPAPAPSARGQLPQESGATRAALESALLNPLLAADSPAARTWKISVSQPMGATLDLRALRGLTPGANGQSTWTLGIRAGGKDALAITQDLPRLSERLKSRDLNAQLRIDDETEATDEQA